MKILFLERGKLWSYGLPDGLRDLGHEVKASGPVEQGRLIRLLTNFKPDLLVSVGWGPDHTIVKQRMVRKLATQHDLKFHSSIGLPRTQTSQMSLPFLFSNG